MYFYSISLGLLYFILNHRAGKGGWTLIDKLADFQLLLYLSNFLDMETDMSNICKSIVHRDIPLDEGYQLIIRSVAGIAM